MTLPTRTQTLRIHSIRALHPGTRLIVLGAVHGNEIAGTRAIERVLGEIDSGTLNIVRGTVTFVPITNPLAYQTGQRIGERNLNRNLRPNSDPRDNEDRIANVLCPLLAQHDVLLDLHSFQAAGESFAMLGPPDNADTLEPFAHAAQEESLALRLGPRRIVEGWLSTYAVGVKERLRRTPPTEYHQLLNTDPSYGVGTTEYMRSQGGYAVTLECGQHDDPNSPEVGWQAIHNALAHLGLTEESSPAARTAVELLKLTEVIDRMHADDYFSRQWVSYDPLCTGDLIATRADGTQVLAREDGCIVFPNAAAVPGNEWFYFARRSPRVLRG
ncbi:MAG: succinylglutamate desuccinylase/aspartoacylase family protein [Candidatus Obscuribacterales bacterium]|nr:succinylglutamate desuccinylase/aspartoacylase family protein [Steroidobacteraceae bacterium]